MPKITFKPMPDLTVESLMQIFEKKYGTDCQIYTTALIGADFIIKKTAFTGISIKLKQKKDTTIIQYTALSPAFWARLTFYGLIPLLILYLGPWKKMQDDIKIFLETTKEFDKY